MNERIKELAKQAGFKVNFQHADHQAIRMAQYTEFAELLIRECLDIVDNEGCGEGGSIRAMEKIKEHFGVEE